MVETDGGEQIQIWPIFSKAGESEKLDRLWAKYASERERIQGIDTRPLELCVAKRMGIQSDRTCLYQKKRRNVSAAPKPIYRGIDIGCYGIAESMLDEMGPESVDAVVTDLNGDRLVQVKPYAEALAALRKAIILVYPKTREQRIGEIMNVARLYLTMSFGAMRLDDLRFILHELEAAEAPTV